MEADSNSLDFGDVSTASTTPNTMTYDLTGANLTREVTLVIGSTNADLFTISPTDPITPESDAVSQMITVTFDPTAAQEYTAMITHSGGGLTSPLVVSLTGAGTLAPTPNLAGRSKFSRFCAGKYCYNCFLISTITPLIVSLSFL